AGGLRVFDSSLLPRVRDRRRPLRRGDRVAEDSFRPSAARDDRARARGRIAMTPEKLVRAYAREATPLHGRGNGGPAQLPSGALILALDVEARARAAVETYRALPTPA